MDAYIYQAALWCSDCTADLKAKRSMPSHVDEGNESSYDSDDWPKGPYEDGGGEADYAAHCDGCGCFLQNSLTDDGAEHVAEAIQERRGDALVLAEWGEFYRSDWPRVAVAIKRRSVADLLECEVADLEAELACLFDETRGLVPA